MPLTFGFVLFVLLRLSGLAPPEDDVVFAVHVALQESDHVCDVAFPDVNSIDVSGPAEVLATAAYASPPGDIRAYDVQTGKR